MKISGGIVENGVVVGNTYNKYDTQNPIARLLMQNFDKDLTALCEKTKPKSIHEIGCGEGFWVFHWLNRGIEARGSDFSAQAINLARDNAIANNIPSDIFSQKNIYELDPDHDGAELIVCCEVLEHLENPEAGLAALKSVPHKHLILSVPREPLWCMLNLARGKYISHLGNTPGHIQKWSSLNFISFVSQFFDVIEVRKPIPWTMLLCQPNKNK